MIKIKEIIKIPKKTDVSKVLNKLEQSLQTKGLKAEIEVGGSFAKNTFLKDYDIDIFIRFKGKVDSRTLYEILKTMFKKVKQIHGTRDYFQVKYKNRILEIIPVKYIRTPSEAENITDISYLHVKWVKEHLKRTDDARLIKLFCKANNIYGAESHINGFSGYILEILTAYYGSFEKVLKNAAKWKFKTIIDIEGYYNNKREIFKTLGKSKTQGPLIIIDPVQKERNAAAALSFENFCKFIYLARIFLKKPSKNFFKKKIINKQILKRYKKEDKTNIIIINFQLSKAREDVAFAKCAKAFQFLKEDIARKGFGLLDSGIVYEKKFMWFEILNSNLPEIELKEGPKVWVSSLDDFFKFKNKYKRIIIKDSRMTAIDKRAFTDIKQYLKKTLNESHIKEKIKNPRIEML